MVASLLIALSFAGCVAGQPAADDSTTAAIEAQDITENPDTRDKDSQPDAQSENGLPRAIQTGTPVSLADIPAYDGMSYIQLENNMPDFTEEEKQERARIMEENLLAASLVPLHMMEKAAETLELLEVLGEKGSRMAVSDVGVAVQFARTALTGAVMNVYINSKSMKNREKAEELNAKAGVLIENGTKKADEIYAKVLEQLV